MAGGTWRKLRKWREGPKEGFVQFLAASPAAVFQPSQSDGGLRVGQFQQPGPRKPGHRPLGRGGVPWENVGFENPKFHTSRILKAPLGSMSWQRTPKSTPVLALCCYLIDWSKPLEKYFEVDFPFGSAAPPRRPPTPPPRSRSLYSFRPTVRPHCPALPVRDFLSSKCLTSIPKMTWKDIAPVPT